MIETFKSDAGKTIMAIYPDCQLTLSNSGEVGLIVGSKEGLSELRIALNMQFDGWTQKEIEAAGFKKSKPLTPEQKTKILDAHAAGHTARDIAETMRLNPQQVSGVIQGHIHPVRVNMANQAAKKKESEIVHTPTTQERINKIIMDGRKRGLDFVAIADEINREVGGHWLANDVANRLKEMRK